MENIIVIGVVALVIGGAIAYIVKAKKSGVKCIGCPSSGACSGHCHGESHTCACSHSEVS